MFKIEKINCEPNDTIIFELNTHDYSVEDLQQIVEDIKESFPKNQVIIVPYDVIQSVKIISSQPQFIAVETGPYQEVKTVLLNDSENTGGKAW
jgi:hypothetical protein